jgi:hypothetical protein
VTALWRDPRRLPAMIGMVALIVCAGAWIADPIDMARAWLTIALLALGFPLGALMLLMLDELTGGRWGEAIRPWLRAIAATLPLALLAFVPLLFSLPAIFSWAGDITSLSLTARHKLAYLNPPDLILRFVVCAVLWLGLAFALGIWGERLPWLRRHRPVVSGIGLGLHALVFTVFATDWMVSLEPDFYSTIYPMMVASAHLVLVLAAILLIPGLARRRGGTPTSTLGEDLAKILVSAVLSWAYLAFMQWIIIWSGDLPDEIGWYLNRMNGGWQWVLWTVVLLGFAVPFAGLISTRGKRDPRWLRVIVAATFAGQVLLGIWRIAPAFPASPLLLMLLLPATLALGGLGVAAAGFFVMPRPAALQGGMDGRAG